jgi:hypothetical protein
MRCARRAHSALYFLYGTLTAQSTHMHSPTICGYCVHLQKLISTKVVRVLLTWNSSDYNHHAIVFAKVGWVFDLSATHPSPVTAAVAVCATSNIEHVPQLDMYLLYEQ